MKIIRTDGGNTAVLRAEALAHGFVGTDACCECGNFTLTLNGTTLQCATCGNQQLPQEASHDGNPDAHSILPADDFPAERKDHRP